MKAEDIIREFVEQRLGGDINKLSSFKLVELREDKVFGCPNRRFDPDDTNLMRAIYCFVFADTWKELSMETLREGILRGDTINTYATFFSYPWDDRFTSRWSPDKELARKMKDFNDIAFTMGNMLVLPDRRIGEWSLNMFRGCHDQWHDYEDRFLQALYLVLIDSPLQDYNLRDFIVLNKDYFQPYYGYEGWKKYIDNNMLEYYVDENYNPIVSSRGYTFWLSGYVNKKHFFQEANRYIDFSTRVIMDRADRMIEKIKCSL